MTESALTPTRPYLARAIYEWICDNQLTPYLLVDAVQKFVQVPQQYIKDGQIVLNIAPHAVNHLQIQNDAIHFSARFGGVAQEVYVPMSAVLGIYSRENGQGLFFDPLEYQDFETTEDALPEQKQEVTTEQSEGKKKPSLRLLD
ncbi:ClpXP protease specificity-enhancing factor [Acinetobacter qingfengensis]|uniref:ClpXP protease specificity-enhancing factor n=1 Tax=Acinetobacter qingfengensis TaxID=1262585 RepID=A0A1E7RG47_9GAMM|nr:ClpXP protease specificity-enhancing factor [Acinetobacter qingfengensis]KAA8732750.1 ClpXP protease specificity-enhancing factor [Acinetobacter qingfengensis]OEY98135.1 ClpXP protease specificity-enhancing factor [Acinetobacter qingfengensis]